MVTSENKDVAYTLCDYAVNLKYGDIPSEAIEATKKAILDILGITLAGSTAIGVKEVYDLVAGWGGTKESSICSFGGKVPSVNAAFINATAAHARDFDDVHTIGQIHTAVTLVPAVLAMAEPRGKVTGKEFLAAVTMGIDLMSRLSIAVEIAPQTSGWHPTATLGIFGSTAACGRLLGFDVNKMVNALGIAFSQCGATMQCIVDGALIKRVHAGFTARGAVLSSLLADIGYTGSHNIFEGKYGMFKVHYHGFNKEKLLAGLGQRFEGVNLEFKPYPCGRANQVAIDTAMALAIEHDIDASKIEKIVVHHGTLTGMSMEPLEAKRKPRDVPDAQFSIPYTISRAFLQRKVGLGDFTPEAIREQKVLDLARKVVPHYTPELNRVQGHESVVMDVHLSGNRVYSKRVDIAKGNPLNPMSWDEICDKFRDCAPYSAKHLTGSETEKIIELVANLERVTDINEIVRLMA